MRPAATSLRPAVALQRGRDTGGLRHSTHTVATTSFLPASTTRPALVRPGRRAPQLSPPAPNFSVRVARRPHSPRRSGTTVRPWRPATVATRLRSFLLADPGITQSHSRPHVSDDNPYSEAQFKTLKYRPDFPDRFDSIEAARLFCHTFFTWYNDEHHHTGLGLHTAADVHYGTAEQTREKRAGVLEGAYAAHPERFVRKPPRPPKLPTASWINRPDDTEQAAQ
jgi:putative transposase